MVARSGAAFIPLGPGQKASQSAHHDPPERYKTGNQECVCVCSLSSIEPTAESEPPSPITNGVQWIKGVLQICLDAYAVWAVMDQDLPTEPHCTREK